MSNKTGYQSDETAYLQRKDADVRPEHELYQSYNLDEYVERTNRHYEQPPEFFYSFTGGEWNCYSCNIWDDGITTDTQSQEAKLDLFAKYMQLKPGMRILDVGAGWAGPLTYLSKTYKVQGVGLTLSPLQLEAAHQRIAKHGADVQMNLCAWEEYEPDQPFDAIYTDEVIVHFNDLLGFFKKASQWLKPGGMMVNKEGHFTRKDYLTKLTRGEVFVNEIYGFTGNYRTVWEELQMVDEAGFELVWHHQVDRSHYQKTFDSWLHNMYQNREVMIKASGKEMYKNFRKYVFLVRAGFNTSIPTVDFIASRKV